MIDGDTIELSGGEVVRYLGIDTPEVRRRQGEQWVHDPEPFGEQATEANRRLVERKTVRLEYDVQTRDGYGRLLAYVYAPAEEADRSGTGEIFVNEELLRQGVAQPLTIPPNVKRAERFRAVAAEARRAGRGLWGAR